MVGKRSLRDRFMLKINWRRRQQSKQECAVNVFQTVVISMLPSWPLALSPLRHHGAGLGVVVQAVPAACCFPTLWRSGGGNQLPMEQSHEGRHPLTFKENKTRLTNAKCRKCTFACIRISSHLMQENLVHWSFKEKLSRKDQHSLWEHYI